MKIALGCDHGGYAMKEDIKKQLEGLGHEVKLVQFRQGSGFVLLCHFPVLGQFRQGSGLQPIPIGVIVEGSLDTASAQKPERTGVREDFEHCLGSKWRVK